jgi:hypothetical protein
MKVTGSVYTEWAETFLTFVIKYCENSGNCSDIKPLVQYKERLLSLYTGAEYKHSWLPCRYLIGSPIFPIFITAHLSILFFYHLLVAGKIT